MIKAYLLPLSFRLKSSFSGFNLTLVVFAAEGNQDSQRQRHLVETTGGVMND